MALFGKAHLCCFFPAPIVYFLYVIQRFVILTGFTPWLLRQDFGWWKSFSCSSASFRSEIPWLWTRLESHLKGDISRHYEDGNVSTTRCLNATHHHFNCSLRCGFFFLLNTIIMSRAWHTSEILRGSFNVFRCEVHVESPEQTGCNLCDNTE